MRNTEIKYCKKTRKYIFSSEAKAVRSMNRYEDIQRVYFCEHCEGYHTTSQETHPDMEIKKDTKLFKKKLKKKIKKRLSHLINKLDKEDDNGI